MRSAHAKSMSTVLATPAKASAKRVSLISAPTNANDKGTKTKFSSIEKQMLVLLTLMIANSVAMAEVVAL